MRYLCNSWQALVQQAVHYLSRCNYHYFHVIHLPEKKRDKWVKIDEKLINKYKCYRNKDQRYDNKKSGYANFVYLRWEHIAIILHSEGKIESDILYDDRFYDIRKNSMYLKVSDFTHLEIKTFEGKITVSLTQDTYEKIRKMLQRVAKTKDKKKMIQMFNKLNGLPAYAGIISQKRSLAEYLCERARKHKVVLHLKELRFVDKRKVYKVWADEQPQIQIYAS